jgi:hypothetical protein
MNTAVSPNIFAIRSLETEAIIYTSCAFLFQNHNFFEISKKKKLML